ncbi:MAG: hypothetical protein ACOY94_03660 [Bacillota bacterium]
MTTIKAWLSPSLWERLRRLFPRRKRAERPADPYETKMLNWRLEQDIRRGDWRGWR